MDGILVINKEKGFTSHDVVAKLRGILRQKKIGHTGTLDPNAEGVLPVCLGRATRVCDLLTDTDKCYETVMRLGVETDTQDLTGTVLAEKPVGVTEDEVREAAESFVGRYQQIPPMYSALKVNGQKLCDLARAGRVVERAPRPVEIYSLCILEWDLPRVRLRVECSRGTYIRTLCHDIGQRLGCGAAVEELIRTRAGRFDLSRAKTLGEIEELRDRGELDRVRIPLEAVFAELPRFRVHPERELALQNGNVLRLSWGEASAPFQGECAVYFSDGRFAAVYETLDGSDRLKVKKMFV
ncbi:MAG: tRNA pseudouridine(55) synthase TruB [Lachnospiraceae bacterium]|nr:tRNA pseudouridine(55) synthase TruB [Lachnospiraceae bacterium]